MLLLTLLLRYDALGRITPAIVGRLGEFGLGLAGLDLGVRGIQLCPRRRELRIQIRGLDESEHLAFVYSVADVREPLAHEAIHPRINRTRMPGRSLAGQRKALGAGRPG